MDCNYCDDPQATFELGVDVNLEMWADRAHDEKAAYAADMDSSEKWHRWAHALTMWHALLVVQAGTNGKPLPEGGGNHFGRIQLFDRWCAQMYAQAERARQADRAKRNAA